MEAGPARPQRAARQRAASPSCTRCSTTASPPCPNSRAGDDRCLIRLPPPRARASPVAFGLVLLAAGGVFAVTMGARQSMGLFLSVINSTTGLGLASISLALRRRPAVVGADAAARRHRRRPLRRRPRPPLRVACWSRIGTALVPLMTTTFGLIVAIGVLAAGGAGFAGPSVLLSATARLTPPAQARHRQRHRQCRRLVRPVRLRADRARHHRRRRLGDRDPEHGGDRPAALPAAWVLRGSSKQARRAPPRPRRAPHRCAPRRRARRSGARCTTRATCCSRLASSSAASTSPSSPRTCRASSRACQLPPAVGAWALAIIGLFNIVGSFAIGWAVGRWRMKSLLSLIYAARGARRPRLPVRAEDRGRRPRLRRASSA